MKTLAALSVLVLLLLAPPAASQVPDDKLIVPGQRIGKWTLEMTISTLVSMNGPATFETEGATDVLPPFLPAYQWAGFYASTRDGQRVEFLLVADDATFKTDKNVGPGSARASVESTYGTPTAATTPRPGRTRMIYDAIGFGATINIERGLVGAVFVFRPGTAKTIWKF